MNRQLPYSGHHPTVILMRSLAHPQDLLDVVSSAGCRRLQSPAPPYKKAKYVPFGGPAVSGIEMSWKADGINLSTPPSTARCNDDGVAGSTEPLICAHYFEES